ncbi:MAG: polysaccharide deacetylase family protein, partial [Pseudomonadota bacterium]|nr:polysaccharide deacetylase family protein [Pseudomonadota bacterium]
KYCCLPERFAEQMAWIAEARHPVSLDSLLAGLDGKAELPDNAVAVTFDDGFASTFEHAMPVLARYRIQATMFMVANRIGRDNDWMHRRGVPQRALVDAEQIREMHAANIIIGSHTLTHPKLPECGPDEMSREIADSKTRLEDILSHPVQHFAYPYGLYNDTARSIVEQSGYLSACSTRCGFNNKETNRYELRRIEVFGSDRLWNLKQKLKFGTNDASWTLPTKYYLRRALSRLSGKD